MDGTLIDSMMKWNSVLKEYLDYKHIILEKKYESAISMMVVLEDLHKEGKMKNTPMEALIEIMEIMDEFYQNQSKLIPGTINMLENLKKLKVKMSIVTATPEKVAIRALKKHGILDYFEFVQTCDQVSLYKYEDEYWQIATKKLNTTMKKSVVFEDALYSIEEVKKLGSKIVAIEDRFTPEDKNKIKSLSDYYIKDFTEMNYDIFN